MMLSVFLSHGGPDKEFAEKLRSALRQHQVEVFLFSHDAIPGGRLFRVMYEGVRSKDRVVLVCSRKSLDRTGVLNEIIQTLAREAAEGGTERLIPILLDDYLLTDWAPGRHGPEFGMLRSELQNRVAANFTNWQDESAFSLALAQILQALIPLGKRWRVVANDWPARVGEFAGNGSARTEVRAEQGSMFCRNYLRIASVTGFSGVFWEFPVPVNASCYGRFRCRWRSIVAPETGTVQVKLETVRDWPVKRFQWPVTSWTESHLFDLQEHSQADWAGVMRITIAVDASDVPAGNEYVLDVAELLFS